jgi:hypothetical protein
MSFYRKTECSIKFTLKNTSKITCSHPIKSQKFVPGICSLELSNKIILINIETKKKTKNKKKHQMPSKPSLISYQLLFITDIIITKHHCQQ